MAPPNNDFRKNLDWRLRDVAGIIRDVVARFVCLGVVIVLFKSGHITNHWTAARAARCESKISYRSSLDDPVATVRGSETIRDAQ